MTTPIKSAKIANMPQKEDKSNGKFIFFDTETTGLAPGNICQLTYIVAEGKKVTPKNFFFTVDSVEPGAQSVHKLSVGKLKELSGGKRFKDHEDEIFKDFTSADFLIAHNIQFDTRFIKSEFRNLNKEFDPDNLFCTMEHFTDFCKLPKKFGKGYKWPKLEELSPKLGVSPKEIDSLTAHLFKTENSVAHDARRDIAETYLCWLTGLEKGLIYKKEFGIDNVSDYRIDISSKSFEHHGSTKSSGVKRPYNASGIELPSKIRRTNEASEIAQNLMRKSLNKQSKGLEIA